MRLNESVYMVVEDRHTLMEFAAAKGVPRKAAEAAAGLLPAAGAAEADKIREAALYEAHVEEELRLQQAEDMVWDGEARSLNEAFDLLRQREGARDRWYSLRAPPGVLHLSATDFFGEMLAGWAAQRAAGARGVDGGVGGGGVEGAGGVGGVGEEEGRGVGAAAGEKLGCLLCRESWAGNVSEVRALLRLGARVNFGMEAFRGWRPLHFAAAGGWLAVVDELVAAGALVNATDARAQTALHAAAAAGLIQSDSALNRSDIV